MFRRIKDLRTDHDLTQKKLAEILGMHLTQYQVYERGEVKIPIDFFIKLVTITACVTLLTGGRLI